MEHPWMIEFRDALISYEEAEMGTNSLQHLPEEAYDNASVARQAAIIQEKEVEAIQQPSPELEAVDVESVTPDGSSASDSSDHYGSGNESPSQ
jgi:mitogen-activated protein kinase kinase kinase